MEEHHDAPTLSSHKVVEIHSIVRENLRARKRQDEAFGIFLQYKMLYCRCIPIDMRDTTNFELGYIAVSTNKNCSEVRGSRAKI